MANVGCFSEAKAATLEIQKICDQMKKNAEKDTGENFSVFTGVCYKDQIVSGKNYLIMVYVGEKKEKYGVLKVFEFLPCDGGKLEFIGFKYPVHDPLSEC